MKEWTKSRKKRKNLDMVISHRLSSNFQIIFVSNENSHADNKAAEFIVWLKIKPLLLDFDCQSYQVGMNLPLLN